MFVNEIEVMYERPLVNVKVERGSTFTYTRDVPYIVSVFFLPAQNVRAYTREKWNMGKPRWALHFLELH